MNRLNLHHQNKNNFGLTPERLIYDNPSGGVRHRFQDIETSEPAPEEAKEKAAETLRQIEKNKSEAEREVTNYNEEYAYENKCWIKKMVTSRKPHEKQIVTDFNNPRAFTYMINGILAAPYEFNGVTSTLETSPDPERIQQVTILKTLKKRISDHITLTRQHGEVQDKALSGHSYRISRRMRQVETMLDDKSVIKERQEYKDLLNDYEQVFGLMEKNPDFKRFYSRVELNDTIDPELKKESRQLFFAILQKETNGFKTDFILSKFANGDSEADIEENKKNYPFIYQEWLKRGGVNLDNVERAKKDVQDKKDQMLAGAPPVPPAEDLVNNLNAEISSSNPMVLGKIGSFNDPFDPAKFATIPSGSSVYHKERISALNTFEKAIKRGINNLDRTVDGERKFAERLEAIIDRDIKLNIELEEAYLRQAQEEENIKRVDSQFTKANLSRKGNRQIVLELAMRKFQKAMEAIDSPLTPKNVSWHMNLHPGIRRLLIATVYERGVGTYNSETKQYVENPDGEHSWLLTQLVQSEYFNPKLKEKYLDSEQREMLILGTYSNLALFQIKRIDEVLEGLKIKEQKTLDRVKKLLQLKKSGTTLNQLQKDQLKKDIDRLDRCTTRKITEGNVLTIIEDEEKILLPQKDRFEKLYTKTEQLLRNPDRQKIRAFIEEAKKSKLLGSSETTNRQIIEDYAKYLEGVELTYNMFEIKERSTGNYLERMGINPEGIYEAYLAYWGKHPEMDVNQWPTHLETKEGTKKLTDMFREILGDSKVYKGKEDFLQIFATLHGINPSKTDPKLRDDKTAALSIYFRIQQEISARSNSAGIGRAGHQVAIDKLEGMTFGDRITDYSKGILNMLIGPNQSIANRAAGFALLYAAYRAANHAIRGTGTSATGLRILFMAGAAELALKHLTGEGLTDKLRLSGLSDSLKDTYEDVLMDRAEDRFKTLQYNGESITKSDHSRALMELRRSNVPFSKIIDWYKNTEPDGTPIPGKKGVKPPIDVTIIASGEMHENKEGFGKFVLKETIKNFFTYVAYKDKRAGGNPATGMNILEEVWVKPVQDRNFNLKNAKYADRALPKFLIEDLRKRPRSVTWQMVMWSEVRHEDIEEVKQKRIENKAYAYATDAYDSIREFTRQDILQPTGVAAKVFWRNVSKDYAPGIKNYLLEVSKIAGRKIEYGAHEVTVWYGANKGAIREIAGQHWELITEGVKLPFLGMHRLGKFLLPLATTAIKQINELLRTNQVEFIEHDLDSKDIMDGDIPEELPASANPTDITKRLAKIKTAREEAVKQYFTGPRWEHFGLFGPAFEMASKKPAKDKYYNTAEGGTDKYGSKMSLPENVGYFISETTQADAGIKPSDKDTAIKLNKMQEKAAEQAIEKFKDKNPGLTEAEIKKYMYSIHVIVKSPAPGPGGVSGPETLYTFWRMPLPTSKEFELQSDNKFPDHTDPNERKHRPVANMDPTKGLVANITTIITPTNPTLRTVIDKTMATAIAQSLRATMTFGEVAGFALGKPLSYVLPKEGLLIRQLMGTSEETRQLVDEMLGSAGNPALAISEFYKNSDNARIYQNLFDFAAARGQKLKLNYKAPPNDKLPASATNPGELPDYAMEGVSSDVIKKSKWWSTVSYAKLNTATNTADTITTDKRLNPKWFVEK